MTASLDFLGFTATQILTDIVSPLWYGQLFGTPSQYNLSYTDVTPSISFEIPTSNWREILVTLVVQAPGASFANCTGIIVALEHFQQFGQNWVEVERFNVGPVTGGSTGNGTGNYGFGASHVFNNGFGNLCRFSLYGQGATPGAGFLQLHVHLKG